MKNGAQQVGERIVLQQVGVFPAASEGNAFGDQESFQFV